ncbi:MAG: UDP-N-acetylmuramoyl-tripeptide--D-alanyl-D-alanine ligase [Desulfosarcinaceae bacterium]|nr:UDP-N-acetylmuramoyl-tripeptide--D-alanyl-D-alanine ligase [Desulfosarcinaceae bacterium]
MTTTANWALDDLLRATRGRLAYGDPGAGFESVGIDSRRLAPGAVFVAIQGEVHDGHRFCGDVVAGGCRCLVVNPKTEIVLDHAAWRAAGVACIEVDDTTRALGALARYHRRRCPAKVVAITGSNGKTSTRRMTAGVAAEGFRTHATKGNFNNEIGLPLSLLALNADHEVAILELGMNHFGEIQRLGEMCEPDLGVITNVGPVHLEGVGTIDGVARAKSELLATIAPGGIAVLNADDPRVAAMASQTDRTVLTYGLGPSARVRAEMVRPAAHGLDFLLLSPTGRSPVQLHTPAHFMVSNALAAAAVGEVLGLRPETVAEGLANFRPGPGRLQLRELTGGIRLIDDSYNANPASMAAALTTLNLFKEEGQRTVAALGGMLELGETSAELHRQLGERVARSGVDRLYAYGELAADILTGAQAAGFADEGLFSGSHSEIAADLKNWLQPGDCLLVKGSRGMKMEVTIHHLEQLLAAGAGA